MKTIKVILISLVALAGLVVLGGWFLPRTAHVERSAIVAAPPAMVFTVLNGYRQFQQWSPWADIDPDARTVFEGLATGVGARMSWEGNDQVGSGSQEIIESRPYELIRQRLDFGGFEGDFTSTYRLAPEGEGTRVTWSFDADYGSSLMGRYFGLLSDRMVGPDYEKGLARLARFVEGLPAGDFSDLRFEPVETRADPILYLPMRSANDPNAIGVALSVGYSRISGVMSAQGVKQVAPPLAIYRGDENGTVSFDAAIPVDRADVPSADAVKAGTLPAGRAIRARYQGPYAGLAAVHRQIAAYLAAAGLRQNGPAWEQYVSDAGKTPAAELITEVYYPIE